MKVPKIRKVRTSYCMADCPNWDTCYKEQRFTCSMFRFHPYHSTSTPYATLKEISDEGT